MSGQSFAERRLAQVPAVEQELFELDDAPPKSVKTLRSTPVPTHKPNRAHWSCPPALPLSKQILPGHHLPVVDPCLSLPVRLKLIVEIGLKLLKETLPSLLVLLGHDVFEEW